MHVIVVGCGRVGAGLVTALTGRGHTVAVIDRQQRAFRMLPDGFRGRRIVGVGFDRSRLEEAGIERCDALAAVTNGDNSNVVVARIAKETYGVRQVAARIYDPRRAVIYEKLGIHTVATVPWSTSRVLHRLLEEDDGPDWTDPSARIALVERPVTRRWVGATVAELAVPGTVRVTGLSRHGQGLVPVDDMVLEDGDVAWLAVPTDSVDAADRHLRLGPDKGTLP